MSFLRIGGIILIILALVLLVYRFVIVKPSQQKNWSLDQKVLPYAEISGNQVTVHNVRNFIYHSETDYTPRYDDRVYDLGDLRKAYYAVVPFGPVPGVAHTFVSFEFTSNRFLAFSIEVRKQVGEGYSILRGLIKPYEIMYVVADEQDVIKLRTNYRKGEEVRLYPIKADDVSLKAVFLDYIHHVNSLYAQPQFYNLFTNSCTTEIVDAVNRATTYRIPLTYQYFLPAFSDEYALDHGLLDTNLSIEAARRYFSINARAQKYGDDADFSVKIRQPE